jgi:predicted transcriptional regulator
MAAQPPSDGIDRLADDLLTTPATASDVAQRLERIWQVSPSQAAAIFGVSPQAYSEWTTGVPADRLADVALLDETTQRMLDRLDAARIPAAVRRPSEMLGGLSLLEFAQQQRFTELRDTVEAMFDITRVQP